MATDTVGAVSSAGSAAALFSSVSGAAVQLTDGWLLPRGRVELHREVPDVDEDRRRRFRYSLRLGDDDCPTPVELPPSVTAQLPSPSGKHFARIVELDAKPKSRVCIELWHGGSLVSRVDASTQHDKVKVSGVFGGFSWSRDEQQAVYVAEERLPEFAPLFPPHLDGSEGLCGKRPAHQAHWRREDWGEDCPGSDRLALYVVDFTEGSVRKLPGVGEGVTPGQPAFWGDGVVYAGWRMAPRRLGATYCAPRPSALYLLQPGAEAPSCLTPELRVARSPRPRPGAGQAAAAGGPPRGPLAFLGSREGFDTHSGGLELFLLDAAAGATPRAVVTVLERPNEDGFGGITVDNWLPRECWAGGRITFNCCTGSRESVWSVATDEPRQPSRVLPPVGTDNRRDSSLRLLAANERGLLLAWCTPSEPLRAFVAPTYEGGEDILLPPLGPCVIAAGAGTDPDCLEGLSWSLRSLPPPSSGMPAVESVLVRPTEVPKPGIILYLHGGPHCVSTTAYNPEVTFMVKATDCAVLQVNYRGSLGFGQSFIDALPGHIGIQDVEDCMEALREALATGEFDAERVAVVGGSHGGFLACHLVGQYPDIFKAACARNPVTNLVLMASTSDIPDWAFVEALGMKGFNSGKPTVPDPQAFSRMWSQSPMAHAAKVQAPTLIALGGKDLRVPPSQGLEFYHALKANGVPSRVLWYEKEGHSLGGPVAEIDHWVNDIMWLQEHLPEAEAFTPPPVLEDPTRSKSMGMGV